MIQEKSKKDNKISNSNPKKLVFGSKNFSNKDQRRNRRTRSGGRKDNRPKSEFDTKMISIRRVARVVAGGRRFSFSVALVAGNRKGSVGIGQGKAGDTQLAIDKALKNAKKKMIKIYLTPEFSIPHEVYGKFTGSKILIMPAPGKGIIAGSSARAVLELAGAKEVGAKILSRSRNRINNAKATLKALSEIKKIKE